MTELCIHWRLFHSGFDLTKDQKAGQLFSCNYVEIGVHLNKSITKNSRGWWPKDEFIDCFKVQLVEFLSSKHTLKIIMEICSSPQILKWNYTFKLRKPASTPDDKKIWRGKIGMISLLTLQTYLSDLLLRVKICTFIWKLWVSTSILPKNSDTENITGNMKFNPHALRTLRLFTIFTMKAFSQKFAQMVSKNPW